MQDRRTYIPPEEARSPLTGRRRLLWHRVVYDSGEGRFSYACIRWHNEWGDFEEMGQRWNGWEGEPIGFPNLRGNPGWVVLPSALGIRAVEECERIALLGDPGIRPDGLQLAREWRDAVGLNPDPRVP